MTRAPILLCLLAFATPARAELPDTLRTMIDAAYRTGDDKTIDAVLGVAKASFPDLIGDIDDLAQADAAVLAGSRAEAQQAAQARVAEARFYDLWKGEIEGGAQRSTGNTSTLGLYAAAALQRDGIAWKQKITGRIDFQQTQNATTTERWIAAWQPQYKFDDRLYATGIGQYEHDRFLGYASRFTLGLGLGYRAIVRNDLTLDLEGGPALRRTDFTTDPTSNRIAGRASLALRWSIGDNLTFLQNGALYLEESDTTATSMTSLDTKLIGALRARLSYNVQYERNGTGGANRLDTISRATLIYGF